MEKRLRFLAALLSFTLLAGCVQNGNHPNTINANNPSSTQANLPNSLPIYNINAFVNPTTNTYDYNAAYVWEIYMSNLYKTNIIVNDFESEEKTAGIAYMSYPESIVEMAISGTILPLDDYLKNNASWNALPDSIKNQYSYQNHIWAVPTQLGSQAMVPMIDKTWLKNVNLPVPQNLNDLTKVSNAFINGDPNKNGIKDDHLLDSSNGAISLIFASEGFNIGCSIYGGSYSATPFGINGYVGSDNIPRIPTIPSDYTFGQKNVQIGASANGTIGYDLKTNSYTDSLLGDKAKDALTYLNTLYKNGAFTPESFKTQNTEGVNIKTYETNFYGMFTATSDNLGTAILSWAANNDPYLIGYKPQQYSSAELDNILNELTTVPPLSTDPQPYVSASGAYVLLKDTEKPKESINLFVNMMFDSPESYLKCSAGVPSNYEINADHTVTFIVDTQTQKMPIPANLAPLDGIFLTKQGYKVSDPDQTPIHKFNAQVQKITHDYIDKYVRTGQLKQISPFDTYVNSQTYITEQSAIQALTQQTVYSALLGRTSVDDALTTYRTAINDNKIDSILGEIINAKKQNDMVSK